MANIERSIVRNIRSTLVMAVGRAEREISESSKPYDEILNKLLASARDATDRMLELSIEPGDFSIRRNPVTSQEIAEAIRQSIVERGGLSFSELCRHRRVRQLTIPRHVAMWAFRRFTSMTFREIGEEFGGRDHSTIVNAANAVERDLREGGIRAALAEAVRSDVQALLKCEPQEAVA